jgi:hypothetical protein
VSVARAWVPILGALALCARAQAQAVAEPDTPRVTAPSDAFFERVREQDRTAARAFYAKMVDVGGMPVAAAAPVDDLALRRAHAIVTRMLAGRPDILAALVKSRMYLIIIGRDQVYTDMPEYRHHPNPAFQNERVRGTGGRPTSFGEENLLSLPLDRYDDESIAVHEFCHTIDGALRSIDPTWNERINAAFEHARKKGLYADTYAGSNPGEYWAEICQSYFDCNRVNNWNHGPIGTREQLKAHDPDGYELVRATFNLGPDKDWRYEPVRKLPNVTAPPARFKIDPYYTKFTWAREFTVVGRDASDAALLKANDTIRKMFAYRHDMLKALIAEGVRLVVLGRDEPLTGLPEFKTLPPAVGIDQRSRTFHYRPETKLLVVGEEAILAEPPNAGDCPVMGVMARAAYEVAGKRPVDPAWETRARGVWQQYELRVKRLDVRFDERLRQLHEQALAAGRWRGIPAGQDRAAFWTAGVLAYFDAAGSSAVPSGSSRAIDTRESLRAYDADLFALVDETFAYAGKVDWRLRR